jgi:hypothetical protein
MSWSECFSDRTSRIRRSAEEMLGNATLLANLKLHTPAISHHEAEAAANDLRQAADLMDKLAAKLKQTDRVTEYVEA